MKFDEKILEPASDLERFEINRRIGMCREIKTRSVELIIKLIDIDAKIAKESDNANKDLLFGVILFVIWAGLITFVGDARQWGYVIIGLLAFFGVYRQIIKQGLTAKQDLYQEKLADLAMLWAANGATNFGSIRATVKAEGKKEETKIDDWWETQVTHITHSVRALSRGQTVVAQNRTASEMNLKESLKRMNKIIENLDTE